MHATATLLRLARAAALLAWAAAALAAAPPPPPPTHAVHERRRAPERRADRRVAPDAVLPVRVGLAQDAGALRAAEGWLMDVSHPASPSYGRHWAPAEVAAAFRPAPHAVDAVAAWLVAEGVARERLALGATGAWLAFDATAREAEALFHTEYYHDGGVVGEGAALVGCDVYHLPRHIQEHVDYVTPGLKGTVVDLRARSGAGAGATGSKSPARGRRRSERPGSKRRPKAPRPVEATTASRLNSSSLAHCDEVITPACLRALYRFDAPSPNATVSPNNTLGIFEEGDFYAQEDFDAFFTTYTPYIPNGTAPTLDAIDGAEAPVDTADAGGESNLDFLLAYPIIYPQSTTLYQVDDLYYADYSPLHGIFNTFLDALDGSYCTYSAYGETGDDPALDPTYPDTNVPGGYAGGLMCGAYQPANVITISYGLYEEDLPAAYQRRQCNEFLKLGLQGVSVLVASGDTGVGGYAGGTFGDDDDAAVYGCLRDDDVFAPTQPNSCPWLTNVGATKVYEGKTVFDPESAVYDPSPSFNYSSSGGFSNLFPIPSYQQEAIDTYFREHEPPYPYYHDGDYLNATNGGLYNRNGRGIPDVAANGDNIAVYVGGALVLEGGTSASSPIFAALVSRLVEERLRVGKGPLGFLNPVLYRHPEVLRDITNGSNPGCGTAGFDAVEGWDPVTGLGTPDYPSMLELFLSLP